MSSLHFWHFCRKIHRFTLIGIFDNDSLLRALSKTENKYFKTICFRYGTSQHIIKHRKIVVNNTNQSKSMDFSTKMPKMKTTHEWKNVSWKRWNLTNSRNVTGSAALPKSKQRWEKWEFDGKKLQFEEKFKEKRKVGWIKSRKGGKLRYIHYQPTACGARSKHGLKQWVLKMAFYPRKIRTGLLFCTGCGTVLKGKNGRLRRYLMVCLLFIWS